MKKLALSITLAFVSMSLACLPSAAQTAVPSVVILTSTNCLNFKDYIVTGSVQNPSQSTIFVHQVIGYFYNCAGQLLFTGQTFLAKPIIVPGGSSPFQMSITGNCNLVSSYQFETTS